MKHFSIVIFLLLSGATLIWTSKVSDRESFIRENKLQHSRNIKSLKMRSRNGPKVLPDTKFLEKMGKFVRERTVSRGAFPHGIGAFGYFVCKHNSLDRSTKAELFSEVGNRVKVAVRLGFSLVGIGSSETSPASVGYSIAIRFYTGEGNLDLIAATGPGIVRDPMRIPDAVRSQAPGTDSLLNLNRKWDLASLAPEVLYTTIYDEADSAFPESLRMMKSRTPQTLKLVNNRGAHVFARFSLEPLIKARYLKDEVAEELARNIPDYYSRDIFLAIERGHGLKWVLRAQIIAPDMVNKLDFNPFDSSKMWDEDIFTPIPIGEIVLNENPSNYFAQVEQLAFNPTNMIPGIEVTFGDKLMHGRGQVYLDAQRHRLGSNFGEIALNRPLFRNTPYVNDGDCAKLRKKRRSEPNYYPNSFGSTKDSLEDYILPGKIKNPALVKRFNTIGDDNYSQLNKTWNRWDESEQNRIVERLWMEFSGLDRFIQNAALRQIKLINIKFYEKFLPSREL